MPDQATQQVATQLSPGVLKGHARALDRDVCAASGRAASWAAPWDRAFDITVSGSLPAVPFPFHPCVAQCARAQHRGQPRQP